VNEGLEVSVPSHGEDTAYAGLLAANEKNTTSGYASDFMTTRPRARYVVTSAAKAMINLRRLGGDRMWDATMRKQYGL